MLNQKFISIMALTASLLVQKEYEYREAPVFKSIAVSIIESVYSLHENYDICKRITRAYVGEMEKKETSLRYECTDSVIDLFEKIYGKDFERKQGQNTVEEFIGYLSDRESNLNEESNKFWNDLEGTEKRIGLPGIKNMPRAVAVESVAFIFYKLKIYNKSDFINKVDNEILKRLINSVNGIGEAGTLYLMILMGHDELCKVDTHIKGFMNDVFELLDDEDQQELVRYVTEQKKANKRGRYKNDFKFKKASFANYIQKDIQEIMRETLKVLSNKPECKYRTVRDLDYSIWYLRSGQKEKDEKTTSKSK